VQVCTRMILDAAGIPGLRVEIKSVKEWVMDAQVAEAFCSGHNRVFLAGDAAHSFPPAGGFGEIFFGFCVR
jgi:2-polyprenyl-6-methoxyphenol hydroxylase-like FAD-dependent oxidoreductase